MIVGIRCFNQLSLDALRWNIMWILVACAVLVIILLLLLPFVWSVARRRWMLRPVPGMKEHFFFGHSQHFINKSPPEILQLMIRGFKDCGKVWKFFMMHETLLMVAEPKVMEAILSSPKLITKSAEYKVFNSWLGDGLLMSTGKKWHARRKVITPTFHFKVLEGFVEVFDRNSNILIDSLAKNKPTDAVDICKYSQLATLDIICETAMGATINAQLTSDSFYVKAVEEITHVLHLRMWDVILRNNYTFPFTKAAKVEKRALKVLHDFTDKVIVARRQELLDAQNTNAGESPESKDEVGIKKKMALLDVLLQAKIDGQPLTNEDIREEVDTFMFEGNDTSAAGINYALYCIAKYPEVQRKVLQEIYEVIGKDESVPLSLSMLNDLNYLDIVIKETMRVLPPVAFIGRAIEEDIVIDGIKIPAGTNLFLYIIAIHMDPDIFPNPEEFRPDRFLEVKAEEQINPYTYVPFSAGVRNCIGQKFVMLEMKAMIVKLIRHFEVTVDPSYDKPILVAEIVLKPQNGILLNFKERK